MQKGLDEILILLLCKQKYKKIIITFNGQRRLSNFTKLPKPEFPKTRSGMSAQGVCNDMTKFVNIYTW